MRKIAIYITIIFTSRHQHRYPWHSLVTPPSRPLLPTGLQGYIPYRHRAAVCRFELDVLLLWRGPKEYIPYELVPTSPAVSHMSLSSNLDSFCDKWLVAVQLLLCGVLPSGLVQYRLHHSCVITIKVFLHTFS